MNKIITKVDFMDLIKISAESYESDVTFKNVGCRMKDNNILIFFIYDDEEGRQCFGFDCIFDMNINQEDLAHSVLVLINDIEKTNQFAEIQGVMIDGNFVEFKIETLATYK